MSYVCVRPTNLMGHEYFPGDLIADEHIVPGREKALKASGRIAEVATPETIQPQEGTVKIAVPISGADGEGGTLMMDVEQIAEAIVILQMNADNAIKAIKAVQAVETLTLIDALDTRNSVIKAVEAQTGKLTQQEEG